MLGSDQVDLKTDSVPFQDKLDHAATLRKLGHVTDGQDCRLVQVFHDSVEPTGLCGAEENNLAVNGLLWSRDSLGDHILPGNGLARQRRIAQIVVLDDEFITSSRIFG